MRKIFYLILIILIGAPAAHGAAKKKAPEPDEVLANARQAYLDYDVEQARTLFDEYAALMKKKKKELPPEVEDEISRVVLMENMLSRVEKVAVVDSLVVDADSFFLRYGLSSEAGRLVPGEVVRMPEVEVAFVPQNNSEILYAEPDSTGMFILMGAGVLDDGTVDRPLPLRGDNLGGGGNAEYPFLMADGMTLYFANDGEGSIGGYDIFLTLRDSDGEYLQPQNIGMPYNSPYDDYMLAIDEATGAGWWATDRNQIPGMVTIYVFEPADTRINVDSDNDALVSLAKLDNLDLAMAGVDTAAAKKRIDAARRRQTPAAASAPDFELPIGSNSRIYTSLADFRSPRARQAMAQAIDARVEASRIEARLADLRSQWAAGNHNSGITILNLEQQLADARQRMTDATNRAISEELNY